MRIIPKHVSRVSGVSFLTDATTNHIATLKALRISMKRMRMRKKSLALKLLAHGPSCSWLGLVVMDEGGLILPMRTGRNSSVLLHNHRLLMDCAWRRSVNAFCCRQRFSVREKDARRSPASLYCQHTCTCQYAVICYLRRVCFLVVTSVIQLGLGLGLPLSFSC
jgi:hypothetical protein